MLGTPYENARTSAEALGPEDQLRLVAELIGRLALQLHQNTPRSLLDLQGLGKEAWHGIRVEEYLARERASWNG